MPSVLTFDPSLTEQMIIGFWVGIGGYGNASLLQAGIGATVTPGSSPGSARSATGPDRVDAGLTWSTTSSPGRRHRRCWSARPEADHGFVMLGNGRTNQAVSVGLSPVAGETANGPSAEWIFAAITPYIARFTPLTFFGCMAGITTP